MVTTVEYQTEHQVEENHVYCANLEANNKFVKGHRLLNSDGKCIGLVSLDKIIEWYIKMDTLRRCEHNCHLCKKEWLGRCFGSKHYGMDVSMVGDRNENKRIHGEWADGDMPICEEYEYGGSEEHLREIEMQS